MYGLVIVRKDDEFQTLCFSSVEGATQFRDIVFAYMLESGAGNGYSAYWILRNEVIPSPNIPNQCETRLDEARIVRMLKDVLKERTAQDINELPPFLTCGIEKGAALFALTTPLPERQRPSSGDMFRVFVADKTDDEQRVKEGRVIDVKDGYLIVVSTRDEDREGRISPEAKRYTLDASRCMKIYDWMAESRKSRHAS